MTMQPFPVLLLRYINIRRYLPVSVQLPDLLFSKHLYPALFCHQGYSMYDPFILVVDNIL